jgi:hypothetical protein
MSQITHKPHLDNPPADIWQVDEPDVNSPESTYLKIQFQRMLPNWWLRTHVEAMGESIRSEFGTALPRADQSPGHAFSHSGSGYRQPSAGCPK